MFPSLHLGYGLVIAEYLTDALKTLMEASTLRSRIIRGCRPEEAEFVLALWRQAEATP